MDGKKSKQNSRLKASGIGKEKKKKKKSKQSSMRKLKKDSKTHEKDTQTCISNETSVGADTPVKEKPDKIPKTSPKGVPAGRKKSISKGGEVSKMQLQPKSEHMEPSVVKISPKRKPRAGSKMGKPTDPSKPQEKKQDSSRPPSTADSCTTPTPDHTSTDANAKTEHTKDHTPPVKEQVQPPKEAPRNSPQAKEKEHSKFLGVTHNEEMYMYEYRPDAPLATTTAATELMHCIETPYTYFIHSPTKRASSKEWALKVIANGVDGLAAEFTQAESEIDPALVKGYLTHQNMNRYNKQYCLDASRVKMPPPFEYYHGSYVSTPPSKRQFICCQAPMSHTCEAFWKMIWHHEVQVVIMLCELVEQNMEKCAAYYPSKFGEVKTFNDITVENNGSFELKKAEPAKVIVTSCQVRCISKPNKSLIVHHYQWRDWPDHGVPPNLLSPTCLLTHTLKTNQPIVIHCSAGIGRTGTLVLIWALIDQLKSAKSETGPQLLSIIRKQRAQAVQNDIQYVFAYRCVLEYLADKEVISENDLIKFQEDYKAFTEKRKRRKSGGEMRSSQQRRPG